VAKTHSAWSLAATVSVALLLHGSAPAGPPEEVGPKANDPGRMGGERRAVEALQACRPATAQTGEIEVQAERIADTEAVRVVAKLDLTVDSAVVWAVLNDYENMPRFVPDIQATRLLNSGAGKKRVAIEGMASILFLDFPIKTTIDVTYHPDRSIAIDSVAGNLAINAAVQVRDDGSNTRVHYQARIAPDFWLPPLIGDFLIGRQVRRQFEGMVAEMHRRADRCQNVVQCRKPRCPMQLVVVG